MPKYIVQKRVYVVYTVEADSIEEATKNADGETSFMDHDDWSIDDEAVESVEEA